MIDSRSVVELGADHMHLTQVNNFIGQFNIGSPSGHVGCHGDPRSLSGIRDNLCFHGNVVGVEHLVLNADRLQQSREFFAFVDRSGSDQDGTTGRVNRFDFFNDRLKL